MWDKILVLAIVAGAGLVCWRWMSRLVAGSPEPGCQSGCPSCSRIRHTAAKFVFKVWLTKH